MTPPGAPPPLACRTEPERWFDRDDRTHALRKCLQYPVRGWCADQALKSRASWGMWAGIWIDGRVTTVSEQLASIAADPPLVLVPSSASPPPADGKPPSGGAAVESIVARSAGHCEIMGPGCRLGYEQLACRLPGVAPGASPSAGYAACRPCAAAVDRMESEMASSLGYLVDSLRAAVTAPFFWRQSRWIHLCQYGSIRAALWIAA